VLVDLPAFLLCSKLKKGSVRTSGKFCLPIALRKRGDENVNKDAETKRRVITYLPPPMAPPLKESDRGNTRLRCLPSPPTSDDPPHHAGDTGDVVLKIDVDEMGKRYPKTRMMMTEVRVFAVHHRYDLFIGLVAQAGCGCCLGLARSAKLWYGV